MKRITPLLLIATALLGSACGSDKKVTLPGNDDITIPGNVDLPGDVTLPDNVTDDCMAVTLEFARVMSQIYAPTGEEVNYDEVFGNLSGRIPDDLQDDLQVVGEAYGEFSVILKDHNNDYSSPEVQAASDALGTPEVQAASDNLTAYFDAQCPD